MRAAADLALAALLLVAACAQSPVEHVRAPGSPGTVATPSADADRPEPAAVLVESALDPDAAASAVLRAPSDSARRDAILGVLAAAGIGVYTADGQPVVVGAERSPSDFFAYDFEVLGLAVAIREGDSTGLADLAEDLATAGISDGGKPRCGGYCSSGHVKLKLSVTPVPGT